MLLSDDKFLIEGATFSNVRLAWMIPIDLSNGETPICYLIEVSWFSLEHNEPLLHWIHKLMFIKTFIIYILSFKAWSK